MKSASSLPSARKGSNQKGMQEARKTNNWQRKKKKRKRKVKGKACTSDCNLRMWWRHHKTQRTTATPTHHDHLLHPAQEVAVPDAQYEQHSNSIVQHLCKHGPLALSLYLRRGRRTGTLPAPAGTPPAEL